jgi:hypothetical protein
MAMTIARQEKKNQQRFLFRPKTINLRQNI